MEQEAGGVRFVQAMALLPLRWQRVLERFPQERRGEVEEFRLRAGQPLALLLPEGELYPSTEACVSPGDLEQMCDKITGYSRYAAAETLRQGYLTAQGGFRVGVCGTVVMQEGVNANLRNISSLTVRLSSQRIGLATELLPQLYPGGAVVNTLILSPPGLGKTTLLRDLIRSISDGTDELPAHRVAVADERGEIAVMHQGLPTMNVGRHTDVMDACPKAIAIPMLLRAVNPEVIAVDEITVRADLTAMASAANCGVRLLATIHAGEADELRRKPLFKQLLQMRVFDRAVTIRRSDGGRQYEVTSL